MSVERISQKSRVKMTLTVPGDKSISHRAVMISSLAYGLTEIKGFLPGEDCLSTIACFRKLGINIICGDESLSVYGKGVMGLNSPGNEILNVGNSGTTLRLITGILSGQGFNSRLTGDTSIQKRPMKRIFEPLCQMGAEFSNDETAPFTVFGRPLKGVSYTLPIASAQVKSAIILAALYAEGETVIVEPQPTRDHTEIMMKHFGAGIDKIGSQIKIRKTPRLYACNLQIPGDISSAAFFIALGMIVPDSEVKITGVGVNPTRTGILDAFTNMGGQIIISNKRKAAGEDVADITVYSSKLKGIEISGNLVPRMIDEIPILAAAAVFAEGRTIIRNAEELRFKESNRIRTAAMELSKFGAHVFETPDGLIIESGGSLNGTIVNSHNDHRIAMSLAIAACAIQDDTFIKNSDCVNISFPSFFNLLRG